MMASVGKTSVGKNSAAKLRRLETFLIWTVATLILFLILEATGEWINGW